MNGEDFAYARWRLLYALKDNGSPEGTFRFIWWLMNARYLGRANWRRHAGGY